MPTERLSMRRIRQVLQLHFGARASARVIAGEVGVGRSTVQDYLARAAAAGIGWPLAAGADGRGAGTAPVPHARHQAGRPPPSRTRLGCAGARDEAAWGQPVDLVGGVRRGASRGLRLQPVLRTVPGVRAPPVADDAPDPRRRAQGLRRLFRQAGRDRRSVHRRDPHGGDLRRRAWCLEPDLRRGDMDTEPA